MHNGMVRFGDEKMAKSVGNIRLLSDVLDEYGRDVLIMYFLSGRYGKPLAFSDEELDQARRSLERVRNFCRLLPRPASRRRGRDGSVRNRSQGEVL